MKRRVGMQAAVLAAGLLMAAGIRVADAQSAADCCSPEAMKRIAGTLGFIDIAGIKLGMTPQQALTAVKAFNPNLKIDTINARVEPGDAPGTFKRVPQFVVAHTLGPVRNPYDPVRYDAADGSSDAIVMEFTMPPSPALVGQVVRTINFHRDQPVAAANLVTALRKKYGQEVPFQGVTRVWAYDPQGKLLNRMLTQPEKSCVPGNGLDPFGYGYGVPSGGELSRDSPRVVNLTTSLASLSAEKGIICSPLTFAVNVGLGESIAPDTKMPSMTIAIDSPALLYASRRATTDWLQAQHDGKAKKEAEDAERRSAPTL